MEKKRLDGRIQRQRMVDQKNVTYKKENYILNFDIEKCQKKKENSSMVNFNEQMVDYNEIPMEKINDEIFKVICLSLAIQCRWQMMALLMLGLVVAAHGLEDERAPGWTTRHERRQWLLVRVKGKERRKENRRSHLGRMANKRQFQIFMMVAVRSTANGMETQQILQQMSQLASAATSAAQAATEATQAFAKASGSTAQGLESATKILKSPDTFTGDDPLLFSSWKLHFESWLSFGDARFTDLLMKTEQGSEPDHTVYTPEQTALANKFFAVLSSYLRGRCTQLVMANQQHKDGFKLWFQMRREFLPATRQRSLAIAQTLGQHPNFNNKISMLENILQYEQLVNQYEQTSKDTYPSDLKTATLIRCAPQKLREHLQLSLSDRSTYADVREALFADERTSKSFSQEQILKQLKQHRQWFGTNGSRQSARQR